MAQGIKDIKGVDTTPPKRNRMPLGKSTGNETARLEVIRPHKYGDGQDVMGTPAENEHRLKHLGYNDAKAEAHRASERSQPYPTRK